MSCVRGVLVGLVCVGSGCGGFRASFAIWVAVSLVSLYIRCIGCWSSRIRVFRRLLITWKFGSVMLRPLVDVLC
uniref:Uncharacterized protein n=1 Tax=Lotus japonicus TaxID=34305 RepID=I3S0Q8_LOTJA|nr:unknown [Lotus japonicus]